VTATHPRVLLLPAIALALVAGVLGIQVAHGGGSFEPLRPADPCAVRDVPSELGSGQTGSTQTGALDDLTQRLVLLGLDGAACRLHTNREALTLELAQTSDPSPAQIAALHAGLLGAVTKMKAAGTLPPASSLVDEALDSSDLNGFLKAAIRALPDSVVDAALPTDEVLTRTIDDLDLRTLLASTGDQQSLQDQLDAAVTQAVQDTLTARVQQLT
jgi:hypothetical protein